MGPMFDSAPAEYKGSASFRDPRIIIDELVSGNMWLVTEA